MQAVDVYGYLLILSIFTPPRLCCLGLALSSLIGQGFCTYLECHFALSVLPHILGNFSCYFSTPPSFPACVLALPPSFSSLHLTSLCSGAFSATTVLWLGSSLSQLSPEMCIGTAGAFHGSAWCGGASPVVSRALTGTVCTIQPLSAGCELTPSAFPGGDRLPLATRKRGLALLRLSCFFNFSPGEVVLMKYKVFSQNKTSRNWNYKNDVQLRLPPAPCSRQVCVFAAQRT